MVMSMRILVLASMWGLVLIAFVVYFVLEAGDDAFAAPPLWLVGAQLVAGLIVHLLLEAVGYRVAAIPPGTSAETAGKLSVELANSAMIRRLVLAEAIGIASLAAAFVVTEGGLLGYVTGAVVALLLLGWHGWPGERTIGRVQDALERDGAASHLRAGLGLAPRPAGPIQEL